MWHGYEGSGWWMVFGGILMILFWAVIIGLVVWAVSRLAGYRHYRSGDDALDIARQRYARGEITKDQYEQLRKDLGGA